jgi:hypothetical protein
MLHMFSDGRSSAAIDSSGGKIERASSPAPL